MALGAILSTGFGLYSLIRVWPLGDRSRAGKVKATAVPCVLLVVSLALWIVGFGLARGSVVALFVAGLVAILVAFVRQYTDRRA